MKIVLALIMVSSFAWAGGAPDCPVMGIPHGNAVEDHEVISHPVTYVPVSARLQSFSDEEKANSEIDLELPADANPVALRISRDISDTWNRGQYADAIAMFDQLGQYIDLKSVAFGCSWRVPIATPETELWGTDVRIGSRDSLDWVSFDIDRASGHLFAVLGGNAGSGHYYVNISLDNGNTWSETYMWSGGIGGTLRSVSAAVVSDYCYVGYSAADQPTNCRARRFFTSTGDVDVAYSYVTVFSTTDPEYIKEVSVFANQEAYDNRVYVAGITSTGVLKFLWGTASVGTSWTDISPAIADADRGLDGTYNQDNDTRYIFISYFNTANQVKVWAYNGSIWESVLTDLSYSTASYTAISAYNDIVICSYDDFGTTFFCPYQISHDAGGSWNIGTIGDDAYSTESSDVTAKLGAGLGATFRYYTDPRQERFIYRGYDPGAWLVDTEIGDDQPYWNKPAIEYIGSGTYGIAYLRWYNPSPRAAYFDKGTVGCPYILGDINGNGAPNGIDVNYGVNYFKGGPHPPVICTSCPESQPFYAAGDVNGNCAFNGIDITYYVGYLKGGPALHSCADCPPSGGAMGAWTPQQPRHPDSQSVSGE